MKERTKRFLASLLATLILLAPLSAPAYADDAGTVGDEPQIGGSTAGYNSQSGSDGSGSDGSGSDGSGSDESGSDGSGSDESGSGQSGSDVSGSDGSGSDGSGSDGSGSDGSGSDGSGSDQSGSDQSGSGSDSTNASGDYSIAALSDDDEGTSSSVTIGGKDLAEEANASAGWDAENKSGWRYDSASGSVSMVNNGSAVEVHAEGAGVALNVAGFNRISTLYADGDVNITGTGIVLIDSIDMLEGTKLNLLTNTGIYEDGTGSAAVFLLNSETGEYELINGSVAGILDEEYTIPEGITLVVPNGGTLDMRVTTQVTTTTTTETSDSSGISTSTTTETHYGFTAEDNDNKILFEKEQESGIIEGGTSIMTTVKKEASFFTPVLNIAAKAALKIQQGAQLLMQSFQSFIGFKDPQYSTLNVSGTLELEGEIEAYANAYDGTAKDFVLNVESGGHVTGSGAMTDAAVFYKAGAGNQDVLNLDGTSYVTVDSSGIGSLNSEGTTSVIYADGVSMGSVSAGENGSVTLYGRNADSQMKVTGSVTGTYTISSGYLTIGGNFANESFTGVTPDTGFILSAGNGLIPGSGYPSERFYVGYVSGSNTSKFFNSEYYSKLPSAAFPDSISYTSLISQGQSFDYYEVYTRDSQGQVTLHLLSQNNTETVDKSQVFLIRGISFTLNPINEAGSGVISSGTSNTGSGILGGENAGSFQGGNSSPILDGSRQPPSPPVNPDPGNDNTGSGGGNTDPGNDNTDSGNDNTGSGNDNTGSGDQGGNTGSGNDNTGSGDQGGNTGSGNDNTGSSDQGGNTGSGNGNTSSGSGNSAMFSNAVTDHTYIVKVSDAGADYRVDAFLDGAALQKLDGGTVHVEMEVPLEDGWNENDLFAVFRNDKGELVAVKVSYDPVTGTLVFESPLLGQFQLVCFPWEGTDYESPAFLAALQAYMN